MPKTMNILFAKSVLTGCLLMGACGTLSQPAEALPVESAQREAQVRREIGVFAQLAKKLNPSVVNISVSKKTAVSSPVIPEEFRRLIPKEMLPQDPGTERPERSGQGSGVIISSDGEILTNNHVVSGASEIKVKLFDGRELEAEVLGTDENTDLALLKLKNAGNLPAAELGDSDALSVGEWVMAIGNPFGLEATVTVGVLSGKGRVIGAGPYDDFLQTDTSINPGNSGGPLIDIAGRVVGINTAIFRGGQGISFSIPINLAKEIASQLRAGGRVERGFLGVGIQSLTPALRTALSLPGDASGALVSSVIPDGPAARAGLDVSDLVMEVDGKSVASDRDLLKEVAKLKVGSNVPVKVMRAGKTRVFQVEIAQRPSSTLSRAERESSPEQEAPEQERVGLSVVDPQQGSGAFVAAVTPNSPAAKAGLRRGDQIRAVGQVKVDSAEQFRDALSRIPGSQIALLVERNGRTSYVVVGD